MTGSDTDSPAAYFPIRIVANETGVNAITLRAWERRYGLLNPKRTAKGHRLYSREDINLIKQVVNLLNRGLPISQAQAILKHEESEDAAFNPARGEQSSQWQYYRDTISHALHHFQEQKLSDTFEEITTLFPIDIALRFLLVPVYRQLSEDVDQPMGEARLRFYSAFIQARLAWRLYKPDASLNNQNQAVVAIANCSDQDEVSQLLLAVLLRQLGIRPVYFNGLMHPHAITEVLNQQDWQGVVIQTAPQLSQEQAIKLQHITVESGKPVFISQRASDDTLIKDHDMIPLGQDLHQAALTIRDLLTGLSA